MADECNAANQAVEGIGSRPSPAWVTQALNRIGFDHVYGPTQPPDHPDFRFEWKNNLEDLRDGHLLRCVFVGSRSPLKVPGLASLLSQ